MTIYQGEVDVLAERLDMHAVLFVIYWSVLFFEKIYKYVNKDHAVYIYSNSNVHFTNMSFSLLSCFSWAFTFIR